MTMTRRRRGVETVESSGGGVEQADDASAPTDNTSSVEQGPSSSPEGGSIESVTEERAGDPFADERSDIERP